MEYEGLKTITDYLGTTEKKFGEFIDSAGDIFQYAKSTTRGNDYWQVSEPEFRLIFAIATAMKAEKIAETGVGPGTTSTAFLKAMEPFGGKLYSFDLGKKYGNSDEKPVGFVVPDNLRSRWTLTLGDSRETLKPGLEKYGPFDIFMHDSEHTYDHVTFELNTAITHMKEHFVIVVDNYNWTEAPDDFASSRGLKLVHPTDDMCLIFRK